MNVTPLQIVPVLLTKRLVRRCSTGVVLTTMLLFSARSRLHHGIVFSNYFNDLLRYIKDFFASKMVFKEKQKTKQAARNMARSSTKKKVQ
ncbi:hypothetical protein Y032_0318g2356 [Ancylostoma ceylanicum]|uniref:Uncharacterized protein n=1 Tax=Ancylostoma ceylanicum TaxID=53326 RepID=A0A016S1F9_9BILA|nr:hypothetical protein Y032_0318g2356 [Ancylostoma ceylanicum]